MSGAGADVSAAPARRDRPVVDLRPLDPARGPGRPVDRVDDDEAGLFALVEQVRRIRALTTGGVFDTDLAPLTDRLREVADRLEDASAGPERRQRRTWSTPGGFLPNCPVTGRANIMAPPLRYELLDDGTLRAEATLGLEYQGPPGCVHGGFVSLLFDSVMGRANYLAGVTGMTMYLDIDYRSPTPILEPLVVTGRQTHVDGRKVWAHGAIHAGERLCATAEGMFVMPREWSGGGAASGGDAWAGGD